MPARTYEERALVARIAAAERWGREKDRKIATAPARAGLRARFEREVIAEHGDLSPDELAYRVDQKMRAHMLRMSLRSAQARRKAREATAAAEAAEAELRELGGGAA